MASAPPPPPIVSDVLGRIHGLLQVRRSLPCSAFVHNIF